MNEITAPRKYEFNPDENLVLGNLSKELKRLGILVLIAGLLFIVYLVISFLDPPSLFKMSDASHAILNCIDYALWVLISLLIIYLSAMVIRLAHPLRLIAGTAGKDISHLMEFLTSLVAMSRISFMSLVVVCVLLVASLVMMILVF